MTIRDIITSYAASPMQFSFHSRRCSVSAAGGTLYSYSSHQSYLRFALSTSGACVK